LLQVPPWQVPAIVRVEPLAGHVAFEQAVPFAYCWQPPAPSQRPLEPQLAAPSSAQKAAGAAVPAGSGVQAPLPERLQAVQAGQSAEPQHTPSTQLPLMHWVPAVQARPFFFSAQLFAPVAPWQV
jgi:hypothetical protein